MGKSTSAPAAPDPYTTAAAQYDYSTLAANYGMGLNAVNQSSPYGTTTWSVNPGGMAQTGYSVPGSTAPPAYSGAPGSTQPTNLGPVNREYNIDDLIPQGGADDTAYNPVTFPSTQTIPTSTGGTPGQSGLGGSGLSTSPSVDSSSTASNVLSQALTPPQYSESTQLSIPEQSLFNLQTGGEIGQGLTAQMLMPQVAQSALNTPQLQTSVPGGNPMQQYNASFNTSLAGQEAAIMPQLNQEQEQLDASLRNSGAQPGTPAYDNAMAAFNAQTTNAQTQAAGAAESNATNLESSLFGQNLSGAEFGNNALEQQQQIPISNYMDLMQGVQPVVPASGAGSTAGGTGAGTISAPNIMQAFQNQYQGQLANYDANVESANATTSDLSSLAAATIIAAGSSSDIRLKKNIERIGDTPRGIPVYRFHYLNESNNAPKRIGVMAQEVIPVIPDAVSKDAQGYFMVDYSKVQ